MSLEDYCSRCGDVIMYCDCPNTDPAVVDDKKYTDNPSFSINRGEEEVEWERRGRTIGGSKGLLDDILTHLTGDFEEILKPGICLWMTPKDPCAVHFVAYKILQGCTFSRTAPKWEKDTRPGHIY